MDAQSESAVRLQTHIAHLKYAVATTTCRTTLVVLKQMLRETEAHLQDYGRATASKPKGSL